MLGRRRPKVACKQVDRSFEVVGRDGWQNLRWRPSYSKSRIHTEPRTVLNRHFDLNIMAVSSVKGEASLIRHVHIHKECSLVCLRIPHFISTPLSIFSFLRPVMVSVCSCCKCCLVTKKLAPNPKKPTDIYRIHILRMLHAKASLTAS